MLHIGAAARDIRLMMPVDCSPLNRAPDAGIPASCQANLHRCIGRPCAGGTQRSNHEQFSEAAVTAFTALLQPGSYGWPSCQDLLQKVRHRRPAGRLATGQAGPQQDLCERVLTKARTDRACRWVNSDWHGSGKHRNTGREAARIRRHPPAVTTR